MAAPEPVVRAVTYERDEHRCVCCGAMSPLSYQHRRAVGMGGSKIRPTLPDGVTACVLCNALFEAGLQQKAKRYGWKVTRSVVMPLQLVPVFYQWEHRWYLLNKEGGRVLLSRFEASARMRAIYGPQWDGWDQ